MIRRNRVFTLLAAASIAILSTAGAYAADVIWTNASGGDFSSGANWDTGLAPGPSDHAIITLDGTYTVTLDQNTDVARLTLGGATGTQTLSMTSRTLTLGGVSSIGSNGAIEMRSSTVTISRVRPRFRRNRSGRTSKKLFSRKTAAPSHPVRLTTVRGIDTRNDRCHSSQSQLSTLNGQSPHIIEK